MNSLIKCLALGVVCAVMGPAQEGAAATPALPEFGHGNMLTKRAIPNAIILVNFTNNNGSTVHTVPYKMGATRVNTNYRAAEQYYSNWFFGQTTSPETLNGYFRELSNGRFQWQPAGVYMVLMDTNDLHGAFMGRAGGVGGLADTRYMTRMIQQAMVQGFDLESYDASNNNIVDEPECTIQLITNDKTFGGGARYLTLALGGFDQYRGWVTIQSYDLGLRVLAEELIHVLQAGHCGDIYGPSGMSDGFTTMSGGSVLHVDAWHKLQLAWCEPRIYSMRDSNRVVLPAAQLMDTTGPVILCDPVAAGRGAKEFFVLEYRTPNTVSRGAGYDKDVADNGLVIWHAQQNSGKDPVDFTSTYYTGLNNWWRCTNCLGLFSTGPGHSSVCPMIGLSHVAEASVDEPAGHLRMLPNDPSPRGVPGWRWCQRCGQLFYGPNAATSHCAAAAGGPHLADASDYRLRRDDDPEALGQRGWLHCAKCESLFRPSDSNSGVCEASGMHAAGGNTNSYTVLWAGGVRAMMTEGSPNLMRSRGGAWHSGDTTPSLRWFDGTLSPARIVVHPFATYADQITIEIQGYYDVWVDFAYGGTEEGSFERPFDTFSEGVNAVFPTGPLHIKAGVSAEKGRVIKPMKIEAYGGRVTLGHH